MRTLVVPPLVWGNGGAQNPDPLVTLNSSCIVYGKPPGSVHGMVPRHTPSAEEVDDPPVAGGATGGATKMARARASSAAFFFSSSAFFCSSSNLPTAGAASFSSAYCCAAFRKPVSG